MTNGYLINCEHGNDDLEKATVAMIIAGAASAMDGETAMFMTGDSVHLAMSNGVDGLQVKDYPALSDLRTALLENGGKLWVCPVCANARGVTADDLVDGAEIAGAARMIGFIDTGAKLLN